MFAPVVMDGVRSLFGRIFGGAGANPQNVDEAIKLMAAETEKLKALAELDRPASNISQWVADLRAAFRYLAAALIILGTFALITAKGLGLGVSEGVVTILLDMSGSVFSFLFGDRVYMHLKNGTK